MLTNFQLTLFATPIPRFIYGDPETRPATPDQIPHAGQAKELTPDQVVQAAQKDVGKVEDSMKKLKGVISKETEGSVGSEIEKLKTNADQTASNIETEKKIIDSAEEQAQ